MDEIGIVIGQTGPQIQEVIGDGSKQGVKITYIPQESPDGLAHAVKISRGFLGDDRFVMFLGDNVIQGGIGQLISDFAKSDWNAATIAAFIVAFIGSLAMWWIYFDKSVEDGSARISQSEEAGRLGRLAYTYLHLPIVAGVIVAAVSDEQVLAHPGGHLELKTAIATIGGPLLFLIGAILFKHAIRGWLMLSHMAGIAALLVLAPFYGAMSPLTYYSLTTLILCVVAGWETLSLKTKEN